MNKLTVITHNINESVVEQRKLDGYINATALTSAYKLASGKRRDVSEWLSNKRTQESLKHLSSKTDIPVIELYQVFQGSPETGGGTWIHPKLAVRFGIWLSDEFGYLVEEWVEQWLTSGQSPEYESLNAMIITAIEKSLTPITQQLSEIQEQIQLVPGVKPKRSWTLPASTPPEEVPPDYVQIEDGSWLSPEGYQSILRQSRRSLPWDIRRLDGSY
ncbi:KilA-N domain-containing protein [Aphanizomenon flos-aquae]|uniref:KilA-N domain-containing protein n=1 Tax=Aphanizomenon flos-aquae TaxID=1176 RepID=UPI0004B99CEE|nr:KilA-N domain-containing protein [Aphanizomenon flos-aquae]